MTKVHGTLFDDGRDGFLIIKPSQPFFGCGKHEKSYSIIDGTVNIELTPTPPGIYYLVGFKQEGDFTRTNFTLRWRIPSVEAIDVTPNRPKNNQDSAISETVETQVQIKRLATQLSESLKKVAELEKDLLLSNQRYDELNSTFDEYKITSTKSLASKDSQLKQLSAFVEPEIKTVIKEVPVPDKPLHQRIKFLEQQLVKLEEQNSIYYKDVVELHQLKLDRAQSLPSSGPPSKPEDNPRQRLLNKLLNR